jgi:hypothetical protein
MHNLSARVHPALMASFVPLAEATMIRRLVGALAIALVLLSSGCALLLVGAAAGTGGYFIRKGEEGGSSGSSTKGTSDSQSKSSSKATSATKSSTSSD